MPLPRGPLQTSQVLILAISVRIWASFWSLIKPMLTFLFWIVCIYHACWEDYQGRGQGLDDLQNSG
jgi:hypothetical protein